MRLLQHNSVLINFISFGTHRVRPVIISPFVSKVWYTFKWHNEMKCMYIACFVLRYNSCWQMFIISVWKLLIYFSSCLQWSRHSVPFPSGLTVSWKNAPDSCYILKYVTSLQEHQYNLDWTSIVNSFSFIIILFHLNINTIVRLVEYIYLTKLTRIALNIDMTVKPKSKKWHLLSMIGFFTPHEYIHVPIQWQHQQWFQVCLLIPCEKILYSIFYAWGHRGEFTHWTMKQSFYNVAEVSVSNAEKYFFSEQIFVNFL